MLRLALTIMLLATQVSAGAWPREKGEVFVSLAARMSGLQSGANRTTYHTFYLEYGQSEKLTLGLDLGRGVSGQGKLIGFARLPLNTADAPLKFALELGAGKIAGDRVLRPGLMIGRGFALGSGSGWLAIDTVAEMRLDGGGTDLKSDITFGLSPDQRRKFILQLQTGKPHNEGRFVRLVPSFVYQYANGRHLEFGVAAGLKGDKSKGIQLGLWQKF